MAGIVLAHCHHAAVLKTAGKGDGMPCHQLRALAEGAVSDDGIQRVVVHVKHRGKIHLNAHAAALTGHFATVLIKQHIVVQSPQDEVALEIGHFLQSHAQAPLAVDGDHQRHCGQRLRQVGHGGLIGDGAVLIDEAAHHILGNQATHQLAGRIVVRRRHGSDDELSDARLGRHGVKDAVHPSIHRYLVHLIEQVGQTCGFTACGTHREHHSHCSQQHTFEFGHFYHLFRVHRAFNALIVITSV